MVTKFDIIATLFLKWSLLRTPSRLFCSLDVTFEGKAEDVVQIAAEIHKKIDTLKGALDRKVDRNDVEFYLVAVFKNREHRKEFTDALGLPDNRYMDGKVLQETLKVDRVDG